MAAIRRVAVAGASGRMGRMLVEAVLAAPDLQLTAAFDQAGSASLGQDAAAFLGKTSVAITSDVAAGLQSADVLIDFTRPDGTLAHVAACAQAGVQCVIGTTGFDAAGKAAIAQAAQQIGVVMAPNMSVGVNVTLKLLEMAARALHADSDIEVIEAHHKHKVDAPSGTALAMGEVMARAIGKNLPELAVYAREGHTGERVNGSIGFSTIRGGDIIGDHTVLFAGVGERIEISHKSSSRAGYAQGSLKAVRFLAGKPRGLFNMFDVLGLA
jgi:4-hydroxy-tetrahydrodipicolinate reductase